MVVTAFTARTSYRTDHAAVPVAYSCRLARHAVLCHLAVPPPDITGSETMTFNDISGRRPFLAARVWRDEHAGLVIIAHVDADCWLDHLHHVRLGDHHWHGGMIDETGHDWPAYLASLAAADRQKILLLCITLSRHYPALGTDAHFLGLCRNIWHMLAADHFQITRCHWLHPLYAYAELTVPDGTPHPTRLVSFSAEQLRIALVDAIALAKTGDGSTRLGCVIICKDDVHAAQLAREPLALMSPEGLLTLASLPVPNTPDLAGLVTAWQQATADDCFTRRAQLARALRSHLPAAVRAQGADTIRLLQHYLPPSAQAMADDTWPVSLRVVLVGLVGETVYLAGSLRDPGDLCAAMQLQYDNGMSLPVPLDTMLRTGHAPNHDGHADGFIITLKPSEALIAQLREGPAPQYARCELTIKGGMTQRVMTPAITTDPQALLTSLQRCCPATQYRASLSDIMRVLAEQAAAQVTVAQSETLGAPVHQPLYTWLYPAADEAETVLVLAMLAHAPQRAQSELFIILRPDQASCIKTIRARAALYDLPVTVLHLSAAGSRETACNIAASRARGAYLVLLREPARLPVRALPGGPPPGLIALPEDHAPPAGLVLARERFESLGGFAPEPDEAAAWADMSQRAGERANG